MPFCCENQLRCFFVAKKYLRILARQDLIEKLRSEAVPQVMIACLTHYTLHVTCDTRQVILIFFYIKTTKIIYCIGATSRDSVSPVWGILKGLFGNFLTILVI